MALAMASVDRGWWRNGGRQHPRGTGTRAWLLHEGARGAPRMACCWIGGISRISLSSLHCPAATPPPMLPVGRIPCVCQRSALRQGQSMQPRVGGDAVDGDWVGQPANANHLGWASGSALSRIVPLVLVWWVVHRNGSWPCLGSLSGCRSGRARRCMRSAAVLLVNDRSICRPAGGVHATRPVHASFSFSTITHSHNKMVVHWLFKLRA